MQERDREAAALRARVAAGDSLQAAAAAAGKRAAAAEAELAEARCQAGAAGAELASMEEAFATLQSKVQMIDVDI